MPINCVFKQPAHRNFPGTGNERERQVCLDTAAAALQVGEPLRWTQTGPLSLGTLLAAALLGDTYAQAELCTWANVLFTGTDSPTSCSAMERAREVYDARQLRKARKKQQ